MDNYSDFSSQNSKFKNDPLNDSFDAYVKKYNLVDREPEQKSSPVKRGISELPTSYRSANSTNSFIGHQISRRDQIWNEIRPKAFKQFSDDQLRMIIDPYHVRITKSMTAKERIDYFMESKPFKNLKFKLNSSHFTKIY